MRAARVLGLLAAACGAPAWAAGPGASRSPAPLAPGRLSTAQAEQIVREVGAAVEEIRGLKFKTPVKMEVIDGAAARASFKARIQPEDEQQLAHTQAAYVHLGLIPRNKGLLKEYLDLTETGVLGYYEHGSRTFYLLSHVSPDEVRTVVAHELTHALEDQHFDFEAVSKRAGGNADRSLAITAVIEGSATAVMLAYASRAGNQSKARDEFQKDEAERAARLKTAPSFTQRSLMLPYVLGFTFLLRGKPWEWIFDGMHTADIDKAYQTPPHSTRQILHPEQYWVGAHHVPAAPPALPDLAKTLGTGWTKAVEGSIGELGIAVLTGAKVDFESFEMLLPGSWTNRAATGVVGDVYHHYVNGEQRVTLLVTRWETLDDAREFRDALGARGLRFFAYGANVAIVAGEAGDKADALAIAAMQNADYWPNE